MADRSAGRGDGLGTAVRVMLTPWRVYVAGVVGFVVCVGVVVVLAVIEAARTWNDDDDDDGSVVGPSRTENNDG